MPSTSPTGADRTLLVTGGTVHTLTAAGAVPALAVRSGRVVHAGAEADCRAALDGRVDAVHDLAGQHMLPGFVDAHCHPVMYGQNLAWADVRPEAVAGIDDMVAALRTHAEGLHADAPVRGFGYEHRRLAEGRHPDRHDLDRVAADREVYVMNASGHGGVVNSHTLRRYGISADTPDPVGGRIGRDASGQPNGELWDGACDLLTGPDGVKITNHGPNFHLDDPEDVMRGHLLRAQARFLAAGVTTIGDAQASRRELDTYLRARDSGDLRMRTSVYLTSALLDDALALGLTRPLGDDLLRVQGVKLYADGTLGGWTAYFPDGYAADCCHHGQLYHSPEEYEELLVRAHRAGLQTATHAQSPYAIGMMLDAVDKALSETPAADRRHRVEHCGLPTDEEIARMRELGVHAVLQPQHHLRTGDGTLTAIGELGHRYNPCGLLQRARTAFALSSDAPVAPPRPFEAVAAAASRRTVLGTRLGTEEMRLSVADGLRAHTVGGATALHREHAVGALFPGALADFVLVAEDPFGIEDTDRLAALQVSETWIGGDRVWDASGAKEHG